MHGDFALLGRQRRFCTVASLPQAAKQWQSPLRGQGVITIQTVPSWCKESLISNSIATAWPPAGTSPSIPTVAGGQAVLHDRDSAVANQYQNRLALLGRERRLGLMATLSNAAKQWQSQLRGIQTVPSWCKESLISNSIATAWPLSGTSPSIPTVAGGQAVLHDRDPHSPPRFKCRTCWPLRFAPASHAWTTPAAPRASIASFCPIRWMANGIMAYVRAATAGRRCGRPRSNCRSDSGVGG